MNTDGFRKAENPETILIEIITIGGPQKKGNQLSDQVLLRQMEAVGDMTNKPILTTCIISATNNRT
ncbi:hypothetical protein D3C80_2066400 [compost metagenome]